MKSQLQPNSFIDDGFRHVHKEIDSTKKTITHYISSSDSNRYGQVLPVEGFDETEFRKNPVVYFNHGADDLFGTLTAQQKLEFLIGKNLWTKVDKGNYLMVKTEFRNSDFAMDVFNLNESGDLNSWSKYFYPITEPQYKDGFMTIDKWGIYEYSSVFIPVDANATNDLSQNKNMLEMVSTDRMKNFLAKHTTEKVIDVNVQELIKPLQEEINSLKEKSEKAITNEQINKLMLDSFKQYNKQLSEMIPGIVGGKIVDALNKIGLNNLDSVIDGKVAGAIRKVTGIV